jgi:DNA-binding transcriptional ArsR family regulator
MNATYPLASVAELMGDPARSAMLIALLDGRALPAGELAMIAGVSPQSASGHLSKLLAGGLLAARCAGRHRYYSISTPAVAHALEALGAISTLPRHSGLPRHGEAGALCIARTCYDHLAGRIAVELAEALERDKVIRTSGERDYQLGARGIAWMADLGLDVAALRSSRRAFARRCLDWTERRPHVAGALGAALCARMLSLGWIARRPGTRALRITLRGARELQARAGISTSNQE